MKIAAAASLAAIALALPLAFAPPACSDSAEGAASPAPAATPNSGSLTPANPLGLTPAQDKKIDVRRKQYQSDLAALKANKKLTAAQKSIRSKALEQKAENDIQAILTPGQRAIAERLQKAEAAAIQKNMTNEKLLARRKADEEGYLADRKKLIASVTESQKTKIKAILDNTKAQLQKTGADSSLSDAQKEAKINQISMESEENQKTVYTSEQILLLKKMDSLYNDLKNTEQELDRLNPIIIPTGPDAPSSAPANPAH